jgi:regulator of protease activity HflC (stomatin/prohibitin superfamily)
VILFGGTLLLATALVAVTESLVDAGVWGQSDLTDLLLSNKVLEVALCAAIALIITAAILAVSLLLAVEMSSEWILAIREEHRVTRAEARRLLLSMFFHTIYPYYIVEEGTITKSKPEGLLPKLGGPGRVVIQPYNAVVFERSGNTTRIEGPGTVLTKRFELAKGIINLRKQWLDFVAEGVLTKDHVPLTVHCGVGFCIESREETVKRSKSGSQELDSSRFAGLIGGDHLVYKKTIHKACYNTTTAGWELTTQGATESSLREVIREFALKDLYHFANGAPAQNESCINDIARKTTQRIEQMTSTWGVTVTTFLIKTVDVPQEVKERLLGLWAEHYERERKRLESEEASNRIIARGRAEAGAIEEVESARHKAREQLVTLLARFLAGQTATPPEDIVVKMLDTFELLAKGIGGDTETAARYFEALEKIASQAGTKVLIIGDEHHLRPPLTGSDGIL